VARATFIITINCLCWRRDAVVNLRMYCCYSPPPPLLLVRDRHSFYNLNGIAAVTRWRLSFIHAYLLSPAQCLPIRALLRAPVPNDNGAVAAYCLPLLLHSATYPPPSITEPLLSLFPPDTFAYILIPSPTRYRRQAWTALA